MAAEAAADEEEEKVPKPKKEKKKAGEEEKKEPAKEKQSPLVEVTAREPDLHLIKTPSELAPEMVKWNSNQTTISESLQSKLG